MEVKRAKGRPDEEVFEFNVKEEGDYFINLTNGNGLQKVQVESKPNAYLTILISDKDINNMQDLP